MQKQGLMLAISAISFASIAFANQVQQQPVQNSQKPNAALKSAVIGNSYTGYVRHNYLKGKDQGIWVAGYGQITGAYNSDYLTEFGSFRPQYNVTKPYSSTTFSLSHADFMMGYDAHHAGFFADLGYSSFADYDKGATNHIALQGNKIYLREAYVTDMLTNSFAIKAGSFISDYGHVNPAAPLETLISSMPTLENNVVGGEFIYAAHHIHASVSGGTTTKISAPNYNAAAPKEIVANVGYRIRTNWGQLDLQGSYENKALFYPVEEKTAQLKPGSAWLIGAHFATAKYAIRADIQTFRAKTFTYKPWTYDAEFTYKLAQRYIVGAYGNFIYNTPDYLPMHWMLGLKAGYKVNRFVTANAYIQRVQVTSDAAAKGIKNNYTFMGALSVKV